MGTPAHQKVKKKIGIQVTMRKQRQYATRDNHALRKQRVHVLFEDASTYTQRLAAR